MITGFWHKTSTYMYLDKVLNITEYLNEISNGELVENGTSFSTPEEFFKELEKESINRQYSRSCTKNIQARAIEVLLPPSISTKEDYLTFSNTFIKEILGKEKLPYASWLVHKGRGVYLHFLVSERCYFNESVEFEEVYTSDVYRTAKGQLCTAYTIGSIKTKSKGEVKRKYNSHFSKKSRLFSADVDAKSNTDKTERIGFSRLIDRMRQKLIYCFVFLKVKVSQKLFIPKKKHFKKMNKYQVININRFNDAIRSIEFELQDLYQILISDAKYCQDKRNMDRFLGIFLKYRRIFKNKKFTYRLDFKKGVPVKINEYGSAKYFYENINYLKEQFTYDFSKIQTTILVGK